MRLLILSVVAIHTADMSLSLNSDALMCRLLCSNNQLAMLAKDKENMVVVYSCGNISRIFSVAKSTCRGANG